MASGCHATQRRKARPSASFLIGLYLWETHGIILVCPPHSLFPFVGFLPFHFLKRNGYGMACAEYSAVQRSELLHLPPSPPSTLVARSLLRALLTLWLLLPLVLIAAYALGYAPRASAARSTATSAQAGGGEVRAEPPRPSLSKKSCAQLRGLHGNGSWQYFSSSRRTCSEIRQLPGAGDCQSPKVWIAVSRMCAKFGARMCTSEELLAGAGNVLGCLVTESGQVKEFGRQAASTVWSSTHCGVGGSNYLVQDSSGRPGALLDSSNASRPFAMGIPNCDMSSGRHQSVCCADSKLER